MGTLRLDTTDLGLGEEGDGVEAEEEEVVGTVSTARKATEMGVTILANLQDRETLTTEGLRVVDTHLVPTVEEGDGDLDGVEDEEVVKEMDPNMDKGQTAINPDHLVIMRRKK